MFELVEIRRQQWDTLIWQIPLLTFTGQAFIFTVMLAGDTAFWGRVLAAVMSVSISVLGLLLLARHRQAEQADSRWLMEYAQREKWPAEHFQHGEGWIARRNHELPGLPSIPSTATRARRTGWMRVPLAPGYKTWVVAHFVLIVFAIAAVALAWNFDAAPPLEPSPRPTITSTP